MINGDLYFFNVAQGNLCLFFYDNTAWFFDAGSNKDPTNPNNRNLTYTKETIAAAISSILPWSTELKAAFVLSHPDTDHYNLVSFIIYNNILKAKGSRYEPILAFNSIQIYYSKSFSLNDYGLNFNNYINLGYGISAKAVDAKEMLLNSNNVHIKVLNTKFPENPGDKNSGSIVLEVATLEQNLIVTGDATGAVIDECDGKSNNNYTIYTSSHHGSIEHNANSKDALSKYNPQAIVISAPIFSGHDHPNKVMIKNALETLNIYSVPQQKVSVFLKSDLPLKYTLEPGLNTSYYFDGLVYWTCPDGNVTWSNDKNFSQSNLKYGNYNSLSGFISNYPLFHTGSLGTIYFNLFNKIITGDDLAIKTFNYNAPRKEERKIYSPAGTTLENTRCFFRVQEPEISTYIIKLIHDTEKEILTATFCNFTALAYLYIEQIIQMYVDMRSKTSDLSEMTIVCPVGMHPEFFLSMQSLIRQKFTKLLLTKNVNAPAVDFNTCPDMNMFISTRSIVYL